jgi:Ni/Co efflux regulator RcnB
MNVRSITACALALALLAVSGRIASAQDRGQGFGNGQNRPDNNADWNRQHPSFNDQDRQVTRDWYRQHQRRLGVGWRERDRLSPDMEGRLRRGQRLDPRLRRQMHWLPSDLSRRYGPAPRGFRYAIIGGNIVLLDTQYQVHDVFRFDFYMR